MANWAIEPLTKTHDRKSFSCGISWLDDWLIERAGQWQKKELSRCFVAVRSGESGVVGYYSLSSHHVDREILPAESGKGLPQINVPVVLLGRLAVDRTERGAGLGKLLLLDALRRVRDISDQIGIRAVEVDAIDNRARDFYLKFGITSFSDNKNHLFLPLLIIKQLELN